MCRSLPPPPPPPLSDSFSAGAAFQGWHSSGILPSLSKHPGAAHVCTNSVGLGLDI